MRDAKTQVVCELHTARNGLAYVRHAITEVRTNDQRTDEVENFGQPDSSHYTETKGEHTRKPKRVDHVSKCYIAPEECKVHCARIAGEYSGGSESYADDTEESCAWKSETQSK